MNSIRFEVFSCKKTLGETGGDAASAAPRTFVTTRASMLACGLLCLMACMIAVFFGVSPAYANSARTQWEGVSPTGAVSLSEDCPIVVQHETLTFDIQQFPQSYYENAEEVAGYQARVTAEYLFANPADYAVTATLVFPFGKMPDYLGYLSSSQQEESLVDDTVLHGITVNGEPVEFVVRHTLSYPEDEFNLESDLGRMLNVYKEDPFFLLEMPVTKYVFEFSDIPEDSNAATAALVWYPSDKSRVLMMDLSGMQEFVVAEADETEASEVGAVEVDGNGSDGATGTTENTGADMPADATEDANEIAATNAAADATADKAKPVLLTTWAENGKTATIYVFGEVPTEGLQLTLFVDGSCEEPLGGTAEAIEVSTMSFAKFALQEWSEESGILPYDWYNAMVDNLNRCAVDWGKPSETANGIISFQYQTLDLRNLLLSWYEYDITLYAGETLTNAVTAPLYPAINESYDPAVYGYTYLLSPAQTWASFGTLDIVVNTPFYLIDSEFSIEGESSPNASQSLLGSLFAGKLATRNAAGLAPTDAGYTLSLESLPEGELKFSLSADQSPRMKMGYQSELLIKAIVGAIMVAIVVVGGMLLSRRARSKTDKLECQDS